MGKLIVISAPSGAGKTSIVHYLIKNIAALSFSISACSREKRETEMPSRRVPRKTHYDEYVRMS